MILDTYSTLLGATFSTYWLQNKKRPTFYDFNLRIKYNLPLFHSCLGFPEEQETCDPSKYPAKSTDRSRKLTCRWRNKSCFPSFSQGNLYVPVRYSPLNKDSFQEKRFLCILRRQNEEMYVFSLENTVSQSSFLQEINDRMTRSRDAKNW